MPLDLREILEMITYARNLLRRILNGRGTLPESVPLPGEFLFVLQGNVNTPAIREVRLIWNGSLPPSVPVAELLTSLCSPGAEPLWETTMSAMGARSVVTVRRSTEQTLMH